MKKPAASIPGYAPLPPEDLRIFPPYVSFFLANIFIMLTATVCIVMPLLQSYFDEPNAYFIAIPFAISIAISVLCILIVRGKLIPIKLLAVISASEIALGVVCALFVADAQYHTAIWIGVIVAGLSLTIVLSQKYYQVALFWQRMMERQFATGLTRTEDIMINLLLEEGTKEGFENARGIVINARERIKKSPR